MWFTMSLYLIIDACAKFQEEAIVWVESMGDRMVNVKPTFAAVVDIAH